MIEQTQKNVLIYLRVSTKEQLDGTSIEVQNQICRDYALRNNLEVVRAFTEKGESAKTTNRTELKLMMDYVSKHRNEVHAIVFYKIDRLSRDTYDYASLKIFFNNFGTKLLSATENLEDSPVGRWVENSLANNAQFDNEVRSERSKNGMIEAVKNGRYVWSAPLGYTNTGGRKTSNLAFGKPQVVRLVRKLWEYIDTGYEVEQARTTLISEGLKISKSQIHRMLKNKVYMGVIEKFGLSVVGNFKPLIQPQLFMRVLEKLEGRSKNVPIYRVNNPDFPIRGLVKHECDEGLTASWSSGNGGKYGYYRCPKCKGVNYKKDIIETEFITYIKSYAYKPHLKEMLLLAIEANLEHRNEKNKKRFSEIRRELLSQKAKIRQITDKNFKGIISDPLAKEMIQETEQSITKLTLEQQNKEVNKDEVMTMAKQCLSYLEDISGLWLRLEPDVKERFQKFLFPSGLLYDGKKFRTDQLALCIALKRDVDYKELRVVTPRGFEPLILWMKTKCPGPLDDGAKQLF